MKTMSYHYTVAKIQKGDNTQLLTGMWSNRNSHTLPVGRQMGIATLEVWGIFFNKIKHILIRVIQLSCSLIFIQRHVYKSVVQNCQILEVNNMSFRRKRDKLWYIWTMEYHSELKEMH